jgi:hypothetical protein
MVPAASNPAVGVLVPRTGFVHSDASPVNVLATELVYGRVAGPDSAISANAQSSDRQVIESVIRLAELAMPASRERLESVDAVVAWSKLPTCSYFPTRPSVLRAG